MQRWITGLTSTVGLKFLMAATGAMLFLFVVAHLLGNLQLFGGPELINGYAAGLKDLGPLLWAARIGLLGIFLLHVITAVTLTRRNRAARPVGYVMQKPVASTDASRSMFMTGLVLVLFVIYHLLQFTIGRGVLPEYHTLIDETGRHDVYSMVVRGFQQLPVALFYLLSMIALGMHLSHGLSSALQSAGWLGPRYRPLVITAAKGVAWAIVAGNIAMPLAAFFGFLELPAWYPLWEEK